MQNIESALKRSRDGVRLGNAGYKAQWCQNRRAQPVSPSSETALAVRGEQAKGGSDDRRSTRPCKPLPSILDVNPGLLQDFLRGRLERYPAHAASRLLREIRELGHTGGATMVKDFVRESPQPASEALPP